MVETPHEGATSLEHDLSSNHNDFSLLPGIAFTGFGALFLAPLLYNVSAFTDENSAIARLLLLSLGVALFVIGLPALARAVRNRIAPGALLQRLERVLFGLAHLTVVVTLLGMMLLIFFDMRGSVSGAPVGIGMLIAGLMYACGGVCRTLR